MTGTLRCVQRWLPWYQSAAWNRRLEDAAQLQQFLGVVVAQLQLLTGAQQPPALSSPAKLGEERRHFACAHTHTHPPGRQSGSGCGHLFLYHVRAINRSLSAEDLNGSPCLCTPGWPPLSSSALRPPRETTSARAECSRGTTYPRG